MILEVLRHQIILATIPHGHLVNGILRVHLIPGLRQQYSICIPNLGFFTYFDYVMISRDGDFNTTDKLAGDMNSKTPMTIISNENKLGIRFRSSTLFNFRGMKVEYLVRPTDVNIQKLEPAPYDNVCGESFILSEDSTAPTAPSVTLPPNVPVLIPGTSTTDAYNKSTDNLIIAPGTAPPHAFPWMAALLIDGRSFCGGSLLDDQHILTAAHCTDGAKKISVLLGAHNIKMKEPERLLFNVSRDGIFQHPDYNPNTISHDISIIRIPEKIKFTESNRDVVRPICLPNRYLRSKTFVGEKVRVSGWGKPADNAAGISPELKNTTVSVMSNGQCRTFFRSLVTGNLICVATTTDSSPCRGDSGGPLILKSYNQAGAPYFMQVGIVSFGGNSCQRGIPVGFTRVTAFMPFISKITGKGFF